MIIYFTVAIFLIVVIAFTWHTLEDMQAISKLLFIIVGLVISCLITLALYNISGTKLENRDIVDASRKIIVLAFTPINAILVMPFLGKQVSKIRNNEIDNKKVLKMILIFIFILLAIFIFEGKYLSKVQNGVISIVNTTEK